MNVCSVVDGGPSFIPFTPPPPPDTPPRPGLLLDRDGVINERRLRLVRQWSEFKFLPGALEAIAEATRAGWPVLVATNQEFVGHGYIRKEDLDEIHARMVEGIREAGGEINAVYACLHPKWESCGCRKPLPGMLTRAAERYRLDLSRSWFAGDNAKDMRAGRAAGSRTVLINPRLRTLLQGASKHADVVAPNLKETVERILH